MNKRNFYPAICALLLITAASLLNPFYETLQVTAQMTTPQISNQEIISRIERLRQIVPDKPTQLGENQVELERILTAAAETRSLDALPLLIKSMGYNHDPQNYRPMAGQENHIPTIPILRIYYAEKAGEALFREAISTDKEWLPERIALAVKRNLSEEVQTKLKERFKNELNSTQSGIVFLQALENKQLLVKLACNSMGMEKIFCTLDDKAQLKELFDLKNQ